MADVSDFAFVVDSGTIIPEAFKETGIKAISVPFIIAFGEKEYLDGIDITSDEFYLKMQDYEKATGRRPTTTQPSPYAFTQAYLEAQKKGARHVIAMPLVKEHSGTYDSALNAAKEVQDIDIRVIDTQTGAAGVFYEMINAAEGIMKGDNIDEVMNTINQSRERVYISLFVDNPSYMAERLSPMASAFVNKFKLKVKVELKVDEGQIKPVSIARTNPSILENLFSTLEKQIGNRPIMAHCLYTNNPEIADVLEEGVRKRFVIVQEGLYGGIVKAALCPAIGRYIGLNSGGIIAYIPNRTKSV